jgi:hypothetical protein
VTARGPLNAAQYYDDLMTQQEDYIQTMAARATMRQAAAQYDDLMSQQEDSIHTMAARATMRRAAAYYDALMAQEEDSIHTLAARADATLAPISTGSAGSVVAVPTNVTTTHGESGDAPENDK